ncbi:MAG TPA: hypothetical protein VFA97_01650 [Gaiellaceae bacterium]|nr:hypothetical protein [Gaiellaceae bacterium]
MNLSPPDIRRAVEEANASVGGEWDGVDWVAERLLDEHGLDAVVAELSAAKDDPLVAAVLFQAMTLSDRRLTEVFTEAEIVNAALQYLLAFESGASHRDGRWAWSALFQFSPEYSISSDFDPEEHFDLVLKLLDRAPLDDTVLFLIGDGPLAHTAAIPSHFARIQELAKTDPKIARAWWLNETDGGRQVE